MLRRSAAVAALALALAGGRASGRHCENVDPPTRPPGECPAIDPVPNRSVGMGLRVFLDRRTGRVRPPTLGEIRALAAAGGGVVDYLEPLEIVVYPDGMRSVDLKGAFEFRAVARRNPDGSFSARCLPPGTSEK
ncbi:MAG TPA: hypothetical protein VIA45_11100 [Thermoanaerobaculia bacterium]|jgi:hypothetical protein